eukprot:4238031-Pyramimonas_sp.AAC.1
MAGQRRPSAHFRPPYTPWKQTARACGWGKTPTGVMSLVNPPSAPNHDTVVGCTKSHYGIAGGCAAKFENLYWYGVWGFALRRG